MELIARHADWIMIVTGLITFSVVQAAVAPRAAMRSMFGETLDGPLAEIIVRNWGVLVGLLGLMLIYGGWTSSHQALILTVSALSKIAFIGIVLVHGRHFLRHQAGLAIAIDTVFVMLFALILLAWAR